MNENRERGLSTFQPKSDTIRTSDGRLILSACIYCRKVYRPMEYWPLTQDFIEATYDAISGDGEFRRAYVVSHGICADDRTRFKAETGIDERL